ncbi:hypothetical protein HK104_009183, partial [Borealophlyctis nickersoniae]
MKAETFNAYFPLAAIGIIVVAAIIVRVLKAVGILTEPGMNPVAQAVRRMLAAEGRLPPENGEHDPAPAV